MPPGVHRLPLPDPHGAPGPCAGHPSGQLARVAAGRSDRITPACLGRSGIVVPMSAVCVAAARGLASMVGYFGPAGRAVTGRNGSRGSSSSGGGGNTASPITGAGASNSNLNSSVGNGGGNARHVPPHRLGPHGRAAGCPGGGSGC